MCGACGRTVVADEVLGPVRTLRSQFIVAQTLKKLCVAVPGLPAIQVAGDGWTIRTETGGSRPCLSVRDIWAVLIAEADSSGSVPTVLERVRRDLAEADGLTREILIAGLAAAKDRELQDSRWAGEGLTSH